MHIGELAKRTNCRVETILRPAKHCKILQELADGAVQSPASEHTGYMRGVHTRGKFLLKL
jgi:hypothetical protein